MRYYTTSRLSENRHRTPEGYLLCIGVPIARIGVMEYLPEEVPEDVAKDANGQTVLVYRDAEDVFAPETIASFEGKPLTIDHPGDFVTPDNWQALAVGVLLNVRRGEGEESDLLLADLLITDQEAIDLIESGELQEVSCGYDAEYVVVAPGIGRQTNIIGNHVAFVSHGRCGSRCAIKDKEQTMAKKPSWWDRIMGNPKVKKAMDEAAAEEKAKDEGAPPEEKKSEDNEQQTATDGDEKLDEVLVLLRTLVERLAPKDSDTTATDNDEPTGDEDPEKTGDEDPEQTGDEDPDGGEGEKTKTGDKAARRKTADAAVIRSAGLLAPGVRFLTSDSACTVKRMALRQAAGDASVARVVDSCLRGTSLDRADCLTLDAAFVAATELMRERNNVRTGSALAGARHKDGKSNAPVTPAQINEQNQKYRDSLKGK